MTEQKELRDDVTLEEQSKGGYDILVDGELVGTMGGLPCRLDDMGIDEKRQGEGIGRAALALYIEAESKRCDEIKTSTVTSPAMEHLLREQGFKPIPGPHNRYRLDTSE